MYVRNRIRNNVRKMSNIRCHIQFQVVYVELAMFPFINTKPKNVRKTEAKTIPSKT